MNQETQILQEKRLFTKYQRLIVWFSNTKVGRKYLGIDHHQEITNKKIGILTPNAFASPTGRWNTNLLGNKVPEMVAVVRSYNLFSKKLLTALTEIEIIEDWFREKGKVLDQVTALLHIIGYKFDFSMPSVMFDTASPYSSAGDGGLTFFQASSFNFTTIRNDDGTNVNGNTGTSSAQDDFIIAVSRYSSGASGAIIRGFIPFDTSFILAGGSVSVATQYHYVYSIQDSRSKSVCLTGATQASQSSLANGDYDNITLNSPTEWASRKTIASLTTSALNAWSYNASGLAGISTTSFTSTCLRASEDVDNTAPGSDGESGFRGNWSEYTGTTRDPYLSLTYTPGGDAGGIIII